MTRAAHDSLGRFHTCLDAAPSRCWRFSRCLRFPGLTGLAFLLILGAPLHAAAEVGTRADASVIFVSSDNAPPNIFDEDPAGGDFRFGASSSQANVSRSGSGYSYSGKANGSISGSVATLSVESQTTNDGDNVFDVFARGDLIATVNTGLFLPAGSGQARLSFTVTLNGSVNGDSSVSFFMEGLPAGQVSFLQLRNPGGDILIVRNGVQSSGTPVVSQTFNYSETFEFGLNAEPRELRPRALLTGATGTNSGTGDMAVTASIKDFSISIISHTPLPVPELDDNAFRWTGPSPSAPTGNFSVATNWQAVNEPTLQQVPVKNDTRADTAIFDRPAPAYNVNVGTQHTERLRVVNGHVTFTNADYTIAATSPDIPGVVIDNARLTLASGQMTAAHTLIGEQAASRLDVVGLDSIYTNQARLRVGDAGEGRLVVADGGSVDSGESLIAAGIAPGDATVSNGAAWSTGNLAVGFTGPGSLTIESSGFVNADDVILGDGFGARGVVRVHGVQGDLRSGLDANGIRVGLLGSGRLTVEAGGRVRSQTMLITGLLGDEAGVTVKGRHDELPSILEVSEALRVGAPDGPGHLLVEDGGSVVTPAMVIGHFGRGIVSVLGSNDGHQATLATTDLFVGGSSQADLNIFLGGLVTTAGVAHIGGGEDSPEAEGRVLVAGGTGASTPFNFAEWRIGTQLRINGNGTLEVADRGGVTIGEIESAFQMVRVGPGGFLSGNGTIIAAGGVEEAGGVDNFAGTVTPGSSPGTLTIEGNYEQGAAGTLEMEFGGREAGQFDQLVVTGNAVLGGVLVLRFIDGFAPAAGDEFDFLAVGGTVDGQFQEVRIEGLQPGFEHELVLAEGTYTLVAHSDGVPHDPDAPAPPVCGPGLCGAGAAPMLLFTMVGLCLLRLHSPGRHASRQKKKAVPN